MAARFLCTITVLVSFVITGTSSASLGSAEPIYLQAEGDEVHVPVKRAEKGNCQTETQTLTFANSRRTIIVRDFINRLTLFKNSEDDNVCYIHHMTDQEVNAGCRGHYVQAKDDPSRTDDVYFHIFTQIDLTDLPSSLIGKNRCVTVKQLTPVANHLLDSGKIRKRRQLAPDATVNGPLKMQRFEECRAVECPIDIIYLFPSGSCNRCTTIYVYIPVIATTPPTRMTTMTPPPPTTSTQTTTPTTTIPSP